MLWVAYGDFPQSGPARQEQDERNPREKQAAWLGDAAAAVV